MENKRAYGRFLDKKVSISLVSGKSGEVKGTSVNLSHDGICGIFEKSYKKDAALDVELEFLLDTKKTKCRGRGKVIWALDMGNDEFLIGINLLDYNNENMKKYINYVDNISEHQKELEV